MHLAPVIPPSYPMLKDNAALVAQKLSFCIGFGKRIRHPETPTGIKFTNGSVPRDEASVVLRSKNLPGGCCHYNGLPLKRRCNRVFGDPLQPSREVVFWDGEAVESPFKLSHPSDVGTNYLMELGIATSV